MGHPPLALLNVALVEFVGVLGGEAAPSFELGCLVEVILLLGRHLLALVVRAWPQGHRWVGKVRVVIQTPLASFHCIHVSLVGVEFVKEGSVASRLRVLGVIIPHIDIQSRVSLEIDGCGLFKLMDSHPLSIFKVICVFVLLLTVVSGT